MRGLGEGEFAKVQACRRRGETVVRACKHISKQRLICQSNVKRTLRRVRRVGTEIEAMRKLRHKSICQIFDVVHTPDYVHIVMENGGRDLYEIIGEPARRSGLARVRGRSRPRGSRRPWPLPGARRRAPRRQARGELRELLARARATTHARARPRARARASARGPPPPPRSRAFALSLFSRHGARRTCSSASTRTTPTASRRSSCATLGCARSRPCGSRPPYLAATLMDAGCEAAAAAAKPPPGECGATGR